MDNDKVTLSVKCCQCGTIHKVRVNLDDLEEWRNGDKLAQEAFPYLSAEKRELLISRICPDCWNNIFGQEDY